MVTQPEFGFVAVGSFQNMMRWGNTSGNATVASLAQSSGTWGVGALADLKGEVLVHDGRMLISRGSDTEGRISAPIAGDEVVLFASGRTARWRDIVVPADLSSAQFEAFVATQAASNGLADLAFPILVDGRFPVLKWHVVTGLSGKRGHSGGHAEPNASKAQGHSNKHASMNEFNQAGRAGRLVGIFSNARLEGTITHPGERAHLHFVDTALTVSGHVDEYTIAKGAILKLPMR